MLQLNYQSLVAAPNIRPLPIGRRVVLDLLAMYGEPAVTARLFYDVDMTWASQLISRFAENEIPHEELAGIMENYKQVAGFDIKTLNEKAWC